MAAEVSGVDDGVGTILETLESNGLADDTIVIFVADQGWVGGHGGFFGMGDHTRPLTARDGMMQIPLIWYHRGKIRADFRCDQMIANYDVMPTLLGHLGLADKMPPSPKSPGRDFSSLLSKTTALAETDVQSESANSTNDAIFYEFEN